MALLNIIKPYEQNNNIRYIEIKNKELFENPTNKL